MFKPIIFAGIKKTDKHFSILQDATNITSFIPIANGAGKGKIVQYCNPSVFKAYDVVNVKLYKRICFRTATIFTAIIRTLGYFLAP